MAKGHNIEVYLTAGEFSAMKEFLDNYFRKRVFINSVRREAKLEDAYCKLFSEEPPTRKRRNRES